MAAGTSCVMAGDGSRHTSSGGRQGKQQGPEPPMGLPAAYVGVLAVGTLSHLLYSLLLTRHVHCNGDWSRVHNKKGLAASEFGWWCRPMTKKRPDLGPQEPVGALAVGALSHVDSVPLDLCT